MDDRFYNGILGCEVVVCGKSLRSLTPWHVVLLNAIESPLIRGSGGYIEPEHLLMFLKVIESDYPAAPSLRPSLFDKWWLIRLKHGKTYAKQLNILRSWLDVQFSAPQLWSVTTSTSSKVGRQTNMPPMLSLVTSISTRFAVKLADAWNMGVAEARWLDVAYAVQEGAEITIDDETDNEVIPDINDLPEAEIIAKVRDNFPKASFDKWLKQRRANR